ncbi:ribonuclease R [Diplocloster agilis]|uniref:Ribonuclease R n=1 Tax=Diplocloster agilis TaxID=2850323 RepID=A0A949K7T5_9FIRM|nr:ribonuclease R [Diplocloster agilis]MBU9738163.1 ribonuclease R [Diplocloster agilis]MBU9743732.1 ribonuclease R [Diplocloster agilis]
MEKELFEQRKKTVYDFICSENYVPMKIKEIAIVLQIPRENREELKEVLDTLVTEGKVDLSKRGKYSRSEGKFLTGIYTGHPRGFGFVTVEGMEEDIFIPESAANGAAHKDQVRIVLTPERGGKRREGAVVKILEHGFMRQVGTFRREKKCGYVTPDDQKFTKDIYVPLERSKGAVTGHKVVVEITEYGTKNKNPEGKVTEIIGHIDDPGTDIMAIVRAYDLPVDFPVDVMQQVEGIPDEVSPKDWEGRLDLREWQTVTIDGEDAKDLDDAITLTQEGDHYMLGVHIADVTHYVTEHSPLDREALKRGTSVYLVDRVIPMLPHQLSNGICSLNAGTERLALSCIMTIDAKGKVVDHSIAESVIRVDRRMSYTSVKKILEEHDQEEIREYEELVPMFERMASLARILREKRRQRGSIDFDFLETKIILDAKGHPVDIRPYDRNTATRIIEDFMLIANETVASDYFWQELPFVYRTHDKPDPDRIQKLGMFINNFGYDIKVSPDGIHPKELQKLLGRIEDSPEENLISRLTLRSMRQARYTTENTGHFGLAAQCYCHFTSPIRRYPDLQIHRIIKENLRGELTERRIHHYESILNEVARHSCETERRADEAERETDKLKKVEYMEQRIGEIYEGVISGVTAWGLYVELPNTVEGMVHITALKDDYYYYTEETYELVGERTNKRYKLGQKVKIEVTGADRILRTIDFELVEGEKEDGQGEREADRQ